MPLLIVYPQRPAAEVDGIEFLRQQTVAAPAWQFPRLHFINGYPHRRNQPRENHHIASQSSQYIEIRICEILFDVKTHGIRFDTQILLQLVVRIRIDSS